MPHPRDLDRPDWTTSAPFLAAHAVAFATPFLVRVEVRWVALAAALYGVRMFAVTAGYHRYFSHRTYRTSRAFQLVLAVVGGAPPRSPPQLRWARGRPLAPPPRVLVEPRRLDPLAPPSRDEARPREGPRALPRAPLPRSPPLPAARRPRPRAPPRGRVAGAPLGLLRLDGRAVARDVHDQLARARLRAAAVRDGRRLAEQLRPRAPHLRGRLAPQPPPLPGVHPPGLLLVGARPLLRRAPRPRRIRRGAGPPRPAAAGAAGGCTGSGRLTGGGPSGRRATSRVARDARLARAPKLECLDGGAHGTASARRQRLLRSCRGRARPRGPRRARARGPRGARSVRGEAARGRGGVRRRPRGAERRRRDGPAREGALGAVREPARPRDWRQVARRARARLRPRASVPQPPAARAARRDADLLPGQLRPRHVRGAARDDRPRRDLLRYGDEVGRDRGDDVPAPRPARAVRRALRGARLPRSLRARDGPGEGRAARHRGRRAAPHAPGPGERGRPVQRPHAGGAPPGGGGRGGPRGAARRRGGDG